MPSCGCGRATNLSHANLLLERLRILARIAETHGAPSHKHFEAAVRRFDRTDRMQFGWRRATGSGQCGKEPT